MKNLLFLFALLLSFNSFSQEIIYKEYSYSQLFEMIENETTERFILKDAAIVFDSITDLKFAKKSYIVNDSVVYRTDTIRIYKALKFENVFFTRDPRAANKYVEILSYISFEKKVELNNSITQFERCSFKDEVNIYLSPYLDDLYISYYGRKFQLRIGFEECQLKNGIGIETEAFNDDEINIQVGILKSHLWPTKTRNSNYWFNLGNLNYFGIENSVFHGDKTLTIYSSGGGDVEIRNNDFKDNRFNGLFGTNQGYKGFSFTSNTINRPVKLNFYNIEQENDIDWNQFKKGVVNFNSYNNYIQDVYNPTNKEDYRKIHKSDSILTHYMTQYLHTNNDACKAETKLLGKLYSLYKSQHDTEFSNSVYTQIKNLETKRLAYLYSQNPSFDTFFTLKINQFLKAFSGYGTRPSKAITFSVYVILCFALIYLFFPNSWDKHGKNRIIDRYSFFFKYMNKKAGIHEVYLDDQKTELMQYDTFKNLIASSGQTAPKFFTATALPMYKWAISGTKLSASFLKRIDIMKGTWNELPAHKRFWKSILLVGAFLIAVLYDVFIKMLNALMLSINTFTTLGFGEIPIKGLPRYLAIIQGFIGWFMLTIFSVSLISQLLN